ncbi:MAG: cytochrome P450 [Halieaceae bacterium]|jgi:cytochrome P450|nr:cytochrome P450 [Halieaceae bacterium]
MTLCPHASLLDIRNFEQGTPREEIARLRQSHRMVWQEDEYANGGHWLVLQAADIDTVLKTPADFTNNFSPLLEDFPEEFLPEAQKSLTFMDPPQHRSYRALADFAFKPRVLAERVPLMQAIAEGILDGLGDSGECEFVDAVAARFPVDVLFRLLGVDEQDYQRVVDITNTMLLANDPDYAKDRIEGFMASLALFEFGAELAQSHRDRPRDSMTAQMLETEIDGIRMSNEQYGSFFNNLVAGGVETTRNTLAWLVYELCQHPEQWALLKQQPELVPNAVEEILRLRNTVVYLRRTATRDMEFAGEQIRKGDKLVCVLGSPNRDPELFDNPDSFDVSRPVAATRRHYRTFGAGPHFCIGVHQARMNLEVMTAAIVNRWSDITLLAQPAYFRSNFMDGFKRLQIAYSA